MGKGVILKLLVVIFSSLPVLASDQCSKPLYLLGIEKFPQLFPRVLNTGFHSAKVAVFEAGESAQLRATEEKMRADGVAAVILRNPNAEDLVSLQESDGFYFGPTMATWHKDLKTFEDEINQRTDLSDREKRERNKDFQRKLKRSEGFSVSVETLTPENVAAFLGLYNEWTVSKKDFGVSVLPPTFYELESQKGALDRWRLVMIRDPQANGVLAGALLVEFIPEMLIAKVKTAAYSKEEVYAKAQLSHRALEEMRQLALARGYKTMSFGSDPNFFGEMVDLGLHRYKSVAYFRPIVGTMYPDPLGTYLRATRIIKVLQPNAFGSGYLFYAFDANNSLQAHTFGQMPVDYAFPKGVNVVKH